jgi:hypothetical protein
VSDKERVVPQFVLKQCKARITAGHREGTIMAAEAALQDAPFKLSVMRCTVPLSQKGESQ